ncbi:DnaB-like helicase C-terminal domain-containing protein [Methylobacterium sp. AMS5]|uniref:DnaB-like helicase C-terminal domain-containing protein n=1 Tax=Methylobacterium sp. AMS5 TaxID=925818 RepID=UPI00074F95E1|nr:DnaB-like helicase C-terminal domain-containing protein [Methylobacterium sp. AMS5]AMB48237.1 DNA helicase [Methylobacterium sp. AMS5]
MTAHVDPDEAEDGATAVASGKPTYEFDLDFQTKIAALAVRDTMFAGRTDGLIQPSFFTEEATARLVQLANEYYRTYKKAPDRVTLISLTKNAIAKKQIRKDMVDDVKERIKELLTTDISDRDYVVDEVATFARHRALEDAILQAALDVQNGDYDKAAKRIELAKLVGANEDSGAYDYWAEIENRTKHRVAVKTGTIKKDGITTGIPELDKLLYHGGWGRKELAAMMAPAKGGKSMSIAEFGKYASFAGFNVIYFTLEVRAQIIADRLDANISDTLMKGLNDDPFKVEGLIKAAHAKSGHFKVHEYPSGTLKPSQIRRVLERYRAQGIIFDLIVVDYADIMAPEHRSDSPIENSKNIWLDLRAIAFEENAAMLTATQTNRDGAKSTSVKATDVAEDYNKIRIADVVIAISATTDEKSVNEARIEFVAHRNGEEGLVIRIKQDRSRMKFIKAVVKVGF